MENNTVPSIDKNADLKIETEKIDDDLIPQEEKRGIFLYILGSIFGVLILIGVTTLAVLYFKVPEKKEIVAVPTITPAPQITETPKIELKKEEITFEVLNATGKTGEAAKIKKTVETLGYKVNSLGNSDKKINGIELYLSAKSKSQKDLLMTDLKKEFPNLIYAGEFDGLKAEARIILGN